MPAEELRRQDAPEVHHIRTSPAPYQFTDFLRLVLGIAAIGLLMPVVVFVSTSARIGAARREQRYAAMRLAGATPRQVNLIAAVEAGAAAVVGTILGAIGLALLRPYGAHIEIDGHTSFPGDVRVPAVLFVVILLGIPALAVATTMVSLRRLQVSPLGVARRATRARPTAKRLAPLVAGTAGFVASVVVANRGAGIEALIPAMATFALMIYGIVAAGPWLTVLTARAIGHAGQRASVLLAGRRLEDDPSRGYRTVSGLVIAVFVASVFSGVTPAVLAEGARGGSALVDPSTLITGLPPGTQPADATAGLDAAIAAGATDGIVLHEDPDGRPPADPTGPQSYVLIDGIEDVRWLLAACADVSVLDITDSCAAGGTVWVDIGLEELHIELAPYSEQDLAGMPARLLVVDTDGTTATTDRVRTAVQRKLPATTPWLGAELEADSNRQLIQLNRLANLALAITLSIAGCSLAVAVAAGIIERKRPFALLRLSGMQLGELQRTALLEAAAPLVLIAVASAVLGLATSAIVVGIAGGIPWKLPTIGYWGSLAGGLTVALGVTAATLPLLGRVTAPSAVRFE
jgi:predicted lysophospholipase L1 biosynthesis ABC-type transport system permease subunit